MNDATKPRILLVEDDPAVQNLVSTALVLHGYSVEKACNGQAAIMEAASHGPDLIMLDLGLPDIDGVEVITKIRSWSAVPITVISARAEDSDKITALDAGADDYLTKPFSVEELLARVRASLRRSSMAASEQPKRAPSITGRYTSTTPRDTRRSKDTSSRSLQPNTSCSFSWRKTSTRCSRTPILLARFGARAGIATSRACVSSCEPCAKSRIRPLPPHHDSDPYRCWLSHAAPLTTTEP